MCTCANLRGISAPHKIAWRESHPDISPSVSIDDSTLSTPSVATRSRLHATVCVAAVVVVVVRGVFTHATSALNSLVMFEKHEFVCVTTLTQASFARQRLRDAGQCPLVGVERLLEISVRRRLVRRLALFSKGYTSLSAYRGITHIHLCVCTHHTHVHRRGDVCSRTPQHDVRPTAAGPRGFPFEINTYLSRGGVVTSDMTKVLRHGNSLFSSTRVSPPRQPAKEE